MVTSGCISPERQGAEAAQGHALGDGQLGWCKGGLGPKEALEILKVAHDAWLVAGSDLQLLCFRLGTPELRPSDEPNKVLAAGDQGIDVGSGANVRQRCRIHRIQPTLAPDEAHDGRLLCEVLAFALQHREIIGLVATQLFGLIR